jgi:hypothetical protein
MSRHLPYFKFFTGEWLNGNITLEDYETQGLFINVCSYYWHRDCEVTYDQLAKKFRTNNLTNLVPDFMQENEETGQITIKFLDEQFSEFSTRKKKLSDAGKKGAKIKKEKALIKPPVSHPSTTKEDQEKEEIKTKKKSIQNRRKDFATSLKEFSDKYSEPMINDFFLYWSEHGETDKKMRFEKQTSFSISRRLGTWKTNENKFKNGSQSNSKDNRATTTKSERKEYN